MTDRMDELLFSLANEENAGVDYNALYSDLLAKQKRQTRHRRNIRMLSAAAAFVVLLGIGVFMLPAMGARSAELYAAPAKAEEAAPMYAMAETAEACEIAASDEAPAPEAAPAAEEGIAARAKDAAGGVVEELPAEIIGGCETNCDTEFGVEEADTGANGEANMKIELPAEKELVDSLPIYIGMADDDISEKITAKQPLFVVDEYNGDRFPEEGYALINPMGTLALWNTGGGVYLISGPHISDPSGMAASLKGFAEQIKTE